MARRTHQSHHHLHERGEGEGGSRNKKLNPNWGGKDGYNYSYVDYEEDREPDYTSFHTTMPLPSQAKAVPVGQNSGKRVISAKNSPIKLKTPPRRDHTSPTDRRYEGAGNIENRQQSTSPKSRNQLERSPGVVSPRYESRYDRRSLSPRRRGTSSTRQGGRTRSTSLTKYPPRKHREGRSSSPISLREGRSKSPTKYTSSPTQERKKSKIQEDVVVGGGEGFEPKRRSTSRTKNGVSTRERETSQIQDNVGGSDGKDFEPGRTRSFSFWKKKNQLPRTITIPPQKIKKKKNNKNIETRFVEEVETMLQPERSRRGNLKTQVGIRSKVKSFKVDDKNVGGELYQVESKKLENTTFEKNKDNIDHTIKERTSFVDNVNVIKILDSIVGLSTVKETTSALEFETIKQDTSTLKEENIHQVLDDTSRKVHDGVYSHRKQLRQGGSILPSVFDGNDNDVEERDPMEGTDDWSSFDSLSLVNEKHSCFSCLDDLFIEEDYDQKVKKKRLMKKDKKVKMKSFARSRRHS